MRKTFYIHFTFDDNVMTDIDATKIKISELYTAANNVPQEKIKVDLKAKSGPDGKLYGSVTSMDVSDAIEKASGLKIDKRKVVMDNIKKQGEYEVKVKLFENVVASVKINVVSE